MCTRPLLSQHQTPVSTTSYTYVSRKRAWRRARDKASRDEATPNKRYTGFESTSRIDIANTNIGAMLGMAASSCCVLTCATCFMKANPVAAV